MDKHTIFYDAECPICIREIALILEDNRAEYFKAVAIQGNEARPYLQADSHSLEKIEETLAYCRGNKTQAAQMLGLSTRQLYYRLEKLKKEKEGQ